MILKVAIFILLFIIHSSISALPILSTWQTTKAKLFNLTEKGAKNIDKDWNFPLHHAVANHDLASISRLLNLFPTAITVKNKEGKTPLQIAIEKKHWYSAALLFNKFCQSNPTKTIERCANSLELNIETRNTLDGLIKEVPVEENNEYFPYSWAIQNRPDILKDLIAEYPVQEYKKYKYGKNPLYFAAAFDLSGVTIQDLFVNFFTNKTKKELNKEGFSFEALMTIAAKYNNDKAFSFLEFTANALRASYNLWNLTITCIEGDSDNVLKHLINSFQYTEEQQNSLFKRAINLRKFKVLAMLLNKYPKTISKNLLLHSAARYLDFSLLNILLNNIQPEEIVSLNKQKETVLHILLNQTRWVQAPELQNAHKNHDVIQHFNNLITVLSQKNKNVFALQDEDGNAPLHLACEYDYPLSTIKSLIAANSEAVTMANTLGNVPLHIVCKKNSQQIPFFSERLELFQKTANIPNKNGELALHILCQQDTCSLDAVAELYEFYHKAITTPDNQGNIPLHYACENLGEDAENIIDLLSQQNHSTLFMKNNEQRNPLEKARLNPCLSKKSMEKLEALIYSPSTSIEDISAEAPSSDSTPNTVALNPLIQFADPDL